MDLHPETQRLMREFFGMKTCCKCGGPASRYTGNQFYCALHFPRGRTSQPHSGKVYRHPRF
jgi:hypothetical protein